MQTTVQIANLTLANTLPLVLISGLRQIESRGMPSEQYPQSLAP